MSMTRNAIVLDLGSDQERLLATSITTKDGPLVVVEMYRRRANGALDIAFCELTLEQAIDFGTALARFGHDHTPRGNNP